jgi:hypothetical protein
MALVDEFSQTVLNAITRSNLSQPSLPEPQVVVGGIFLLETASGLNFIRLLPMHVPLIDQFATHIQDIG